MADLGLRRKYESRFGETHGEKLRKERRAFQTEQARDLAKISMAELERAEVGETKRAEITEAGLGRRLGREQEFARPGQAAEIRRLKALGGLRGAEAEKVRYGTEFARGARGTLEGILESQRKLAGVEAREAELGLSEEERTIRRRDEAEAEAEIEAARPIVPEAEVPARPGREIRPGIKKALWTGYDTKWGFHVPGFAAPAKGYFDIAEMLGRGARKGYEWAFPRGK